MFLTSLRKRLLPACAFLVMPTLAMAHPGHGDASGFLHGAAHPLLGVDHLIAMIAVGILAARLGRSALWALPAAFLTLMAVGGALGMSGIALSFTEIAIAFSVIVFGGLVALNVQLPVTLVATAVGFFAVFHGFAHGAEMPATASGISYAAGFMTATALLHGAGLMIGLAADRISRRFGNIALRIGGGAATLAGLSFLGASLAG